MNPKRHQSIAHFPLLESSGRAETACDITPLAANPSPATNAVTASRTREDLMAALDCEIARGLAEGDLVIPKLRRNDPAWLTRNVRIHNPNARGKAVHALALEVFKIDVRASLSAPDRDQDDTPSSP